MSLLTSTCFFSIYRLLFVTNITIARVPNIACIADTSSFATVNSLCLTPVDSCIYGRPKGVKHTMKYEALLDSQRETIFDPAISGWVVGGRDNRPSPVFAKKSKLRWAEGLH